MIAPPKSKTGIVILNWNGYADTRECLESLRIHERADVLVVDNGSADGSGKRLATEFPGVVFLWNASNLGFATGCNQGMAYWFDRGYDAVFLLNNDTIVRHPFLAALEPLCEQLPDAGVIGPVVAEAWSPDRIQSFGGAVNLWTGGAPYLRRGELLTGRLGLQVVDYVLGAAFMIPRRTYEAIGPLDEAFSPAYYEEADYCLRARKAGLRSYVTDAVTIWHKGGRSGGGHAKVFKLMMRNKWIFERRHARSFQLPVFAATWIGHYLWRTLIRPFPAVNPIAPRTDP